MSVSRGMRRKLESYSQLSIPFSKWPTLTLSTVLTKRRCVSNATEITLC